MSDDKTRIQVRVTEEQKDDWMRRVEDTTHLKSLSHLVRVAVEEYLDAQTKKEARKNEELLGAIEYVIDQQTNVQDELEALKQQQVTQDDIDALQSQIDEINQ